MEEEIPGLLDDESLGSEAEGSAAIGETDSDQTQGAFSDWQGTQPQTVYRRGLESGTEGLGELLWSF